MIKRKPLVTGESVWIQSKELSSEQYTNPVEYIVVEANTSSAYAMPVGEEDDKKSIHRLRINQRNFEIKSKMWFKRYIFWNSLEEYEEDIKASTYSDMVNKEAMRILDELSLEQKVQFIKQFKS